jgi:UDP-N-acetylmuramate dehydrogenase
MIAVAAREALEEALGDRIRFDVPMSRYTSLRVGGPADALASPSSRADLAQLLAVCNAQRLPHAVLGAGFNTLALDHRIEGVVIQMSRLRRLEERPGWR